MIQKLRARRIKRHYLKIAKLEQKTSAKLWADLRVEFANDTMKIIDSAMKNAGATRHERRMMKRRIVNTKVA